MTTQIRVPSGSELREELAGIDALLTAKKWARAAIVFAFTTNEGKGGRQNPEPPKMTMREFARQGFAGLSSNKSVERYRAAWVTAINNGWASPVAPGEHVNLPDQPFPAWEQSAEISANATVTEHDNVSALDDRRPSTRGPNRPVEARVLEHLDRAATAMSMLADSFNPDELDDTMRRELIEKLNELQRQTREALRALQGLAVV